MDNIEKIENYIKFLEEQIEVRDKLIELYKAKSNIPNVQVRTIPVYYSFPLGLQLKP